MDGFYGGQPGTSFVLKAAFDTIEDMVALFSQGATYKDVWYGEYCIISTKNRNNPDNGKIYRRGANYTNAMGGAEYIGRIVGPASGTPFFEIDTCNNVVKNLQKADKKAEVYYRAPNDKNDNAVYVNDTASALDLKTITSNDIYTGTYNIENSSITPGKYIDEDGNIQFNDNITWQWVNIRDYDESADVDKESMFYVGFSIPYTVVDFDTTTVNPYSESTTTRHSGEGYDEHPFFEQWNITIPKGIKGDTLSQFKVWTGSVDFTSTDDIVFYYPQAINNDIDDNGNAVTVLDDKYAVEDTLISDWIEHGRQILVYELVVYDTSAEGAVFYIYLGEYNLIKNIELTDDGTLTFEYTYDDKLQYDKKLKWIKSIMFNTNSGEASVSEDYTNKAKPGQLRIDYNTGEDAYVVDINFVKRIALAKDGTVTYEYSGRPAGTNAQGIMTDETIINWINKVELDQDTGSFKITFNNTNLGEVNALGEKTNTLERQLNWINKILLNNEGILTAYMCDGQTTQIINSDNELEWLTEASYDSSTGRFILRTNKRDGLTHTGETTPRDIFLDTQLIYPLDISADTNGNLLITDTAGSVTTLSNVMTKITAATITDYETTGPDNGKIVFTTNNKDSNNKAIEITLQQAGTNKDFQLKTLKNVYLNTDLSEDKHIKVQYNTESSALSIGNTINDIEDVVVNSDTNGNYHLYVLFSDRTKRYPYNVATEEQRDNAKALQNIIDGKDSAASALNTNNQDQYGNRWVTGIKGSSGSSYTGSDNIAVYWRDYGSVKDQAGVLVGLQVTEDIIAEYNAAHSGVNIDTKDIITYLNTAYPSGYSNGKVAIFGYDGTEDKDFYGFDYNTDANGNYNGWFKIGGISDSASRDVILYTNTNAATPSNSLSSTANPTTGEAESLTSLGIAFNVLSRPTANQNLILNTPWIPAAAATR
jgi:hypothetical protein